MRKFLILTAFATLSACSAFDEVTMCPNGRQLVSTPGLGPDFGSCDPKMQDLADKLVAAGREYRIVTPADIAANAQAYPASPIGAHGVRVK